MKKLTLLLASTALLGTGAFAFAQSGNAYADAWVTQLEAEGYTEVTVEIKNGEVEIEGLKNGEEREVTLDEATGAVISDLTEADDQDDAAEDENEPEDDQDEDESDEDDDDEDDD